jgi:aerobic carbon-monoxide dehydrogenase medium subunit
MKPPRFEYHDPASPREAAQILADAGGDGKVLAGGQSLMPMLNMRLARPSVLVDVHRLDELSYVRRDNGHLAVGAVTTHAAVLASAEARAACPLLPLALPLVGHAAIRNRGTVGGSLAHADPNAELPAVALTLDATFVAESVRGRRELPASDFFVSWFTPALEPDELLVEVRFEAQPPAAGSAFEEVARRHGDFAQVGIAATLELGPGDVPRDVRLTSFATGPTPVRLIAAEAELDGRPLSEESLDAAARAASAAVEPVDDVHATADYRREVLARLLRRAVRAAAEDSRARRGVTA